MSTITDLVDRYVAIWNETDATRRRELIAESWGETASYVDPLAAVDGRAGLDALIGQLQQRFPGHHLRRTGDVDTHHDRLRFAWALLAPGGATVFAGIDFAVVAPDRRLQAVTGFFDTTPDSRN